MGSVIVGAVPGFEEVLDAVRHHHGAGTAAATRSG